MFILFVIVFINLVGFGIIIPLLPFYGLHYGASPDQVTLLMAFYSLAQLIAAPIWGRLSDRYGRRPILLLSLAGTVLAYIWLAEATSLLSLYSARAFGGVMAGSIGAAFAYVADVTTREDRAKGMGLIGAAFGLGFIAGPAIGGLLAGSDPTNINFPLPSYVAAGFSAAAVILAAILLKESLPAEKRGAQSGSSGREAFAETLRRRDVRFTILLTFLAIFVFAGLEATFALWTEQKFGWGVAQNGYVFAFTGVVSALIQGGLVGRLSRRIGETGMIKQGFLALGIGLAILPFSDSLTLLLISMMIITYGFSIASPALSSLLSLQVSDDQQGGILGISRSASTLARAVGPASAGYIFAFMGKDWPFWVGAIVILAVLMLSLKLRPATVPDR